MNKLINLALAGTMILAALACQREPAGLNDEAAEGGVREVTTQFVLDIASAPTTKQTADVVQLNENFRGIGDGWLYIYKTNITGASPAVLNTSWAQEKMFDFETFAGSGYLDNSGNVADANGDLNNSNNNNKTGEHEVASRRVLQLSLPVGADAVQFYGRATRPDKNADEKDKENYKYGGTNSANTIISGTPDDMVIAARRILNETNNGSYTHTSNLMIAVINDLLGQSVSDDGSISGTGYSYDDLPAVSWADYGHRYEYENIDPSRYGAGDFSIDHDLDGLEEILGKCYYLFTYIRPAETNPYNPDTQAELYAEWYTTHNDRPNGEYRAGSSAAVKQMVIDIYKVITAASIADPGDADEANAKRLADQILERAADFFYMTDGTGGATYKAGDYKPKNTLKTKLTWIPEVDWNNDYKNAEDLNSYPTFFGVPEGAAQLGFVQKGGTYPAQSGKTGTAASDAFFYYHPNKPLVNPTMQWFDAKKYLHPAELWYYVNSSIRVTEKDVNVSDYPDGVTNWNTDASWTAKAWQADGKVSGSTRGVAVTSSINYGVALLKSSVQYSADELYDNRAKLTTDEGNKTLYPSTIGLTLTGVLVGGVNPRMNWQFLRKYETTGDHEDLGDLSLFDGVIYDRYLSDAAASIPAVSGTPTAPNYTLVYDNYNSSGSGDLEDQNDVYIALQFKNGPTAFFGRDNMIPAGGTFYLVAKLTKPASNSLTWPTDHQIPPLKGVNATAEDIATLKEAGEYGQSKKIPRVFIQDFVTTAKFKIGATSLQNAYYSVPDLRASQMSLGLSVDLEWEPGMVYDNLVL